MLLTMAAFGLAAAEMVQESQQPCALQLNSETLPTLASLLKSVCENAVTKLESNGASLSEIFG